MPRNGAVFCRNLTLSYVHAQMFGVKFRVLSYSLFPISSPSRKRADREHFAFNITASTPNGNAYQPNIHQYEDRNNQRDDSRTMSDYILSSLNVC